MLQKVFTKAFRLFQTHFSYL